VKKVGIITCANVTQDMGCCSFMCLKELNSLTGPFEQYVEYGGAQLMGIISCAGCPTAAVPEKILSRVRALAELGCEVIHIDSCMEYVCPFKNKYKALIEENFPGVGVEIGTHAYLVDKETSQKLFRKITGDILLQQRLYMTDMFKQVIELEKKGSDEIEDAVKKAVT
jgi:predicted metal-binding protein